MIWIATLCLLAVSAWLFFNALNERRWVNTHLHDETVASDQGFLPNFTTMTQSIHASGDGKLSIDQENTRFSRAVRRVREKSSEYGERFFEQKAVAARSGGEENSFFGRMVARTGAGVASIDKRLDAKMEKASSQPVISTSDTSAGNYASRGTFFERTARNVAIKSDELSTRVANMARERASRYSEKREPVEGEGRFDRIVARVSQRLDQVDQKIDQRMTAARVDGQKSTVQPEHSSDDLIGRVAARVGKRINDIDASPQSRNRTDDSSS